MGKLNVDFKVVGPVQTNCYFVTDPETGECVIVDPGAEAEKLISYVKEKGVTVSAVLLTHGHFDHIMAVGSLREAFHMPVYAAEEEKKILLDADYNLSIEMGASVTVEADDWLHDGQKMELLGQEVRCILTPGHTCGGMCYYFPKEGILFSGDTLFQESVGRTDFPTGSMSTLIRSVREKLFVLPKAVHVYTGHGMMTSIENEVMYNPFTEW